jgi:hypothetical protein
VSVYYVRAPDLGLVKIGFAEKPKARFSKIQSDSPTRLVLAAVEAGNEVIEQARHVQFAEYRQRGEWFRHEGRLAEHISALGPILPREKSLNAKIVALGISKAHASQIVNGKHSPSLSLAVAIWRATGWKCQRIAHATDEQLAVIEEIDPWTPKERQDEAA